MAGPICTSRTIFHENDYLYLNNKNGTFSEKLTQSFQHTSRFSMGTDVADFNNDQLPDVVTLDMKPEQEHILKTAAPEDAFNIYQFKLSYGYFYQFSRNNLQLHAGFDRNGLPKFREIGQLAGVDATDWSWSALLADFDQDGWKDLFIANGIYRRPNDMDYLKYLTDGDLKRSLAAGITRENLQAVTQMPQVPQPNYLFRNNQDLTFTNMAADWGLERAGFSNGVAYADLDNDGDLDLVINHLQETASIHENRAEQQPNPAKFVRIRLVGEGRNRFGVGAKVWVYAQGKAQYQEQSPVRGFQSSVDPTLVFGLGQAPQVDSIVVVWPQNRKSVSANAAVNQTYRIEEKQR